MSLFDKISKIFDLAVKNEDNIKKTIDYLVRFGYLDAKGENTIETVLSAIVKLHTVAGLKSTDIITGKTLSVMELPRCSMMDNLAEDSNALAKWGSNHLNYCILQRDSDMSAGDWDAAIAQALANWSAVANLTFTQVPNVNDAQIVLSLGRGSRDQFDGPSGVLAWCELPSTSNFSGQLQNKYDQDENWLYNNPAGHGIYLVNVACHELGHGLGLTHSQISSALMAPFYNPSTSKPQANDDIPRMVARYGSPVNTPAPPVVPPSVPPSNPSNLTINLIGSISKIDIPGYRIQKIS